MVRIRVLALCAIFLCLTSGCAYHFQGAHNSLKDLGIQKIYVSNFRNRTFRPGLEQLFTKAMVREIARSRSFELVNSPKEADAILSGEVTTADIAVNATESFSVTGGSLDIANEYNSSVSCSVSLRDKDGRQIFSRSVSDSKVHPGAGELGDDGATAALINDSEQRLAIQFLASQMMASVYQRMIDTF